MRGLIVVILALCATGCCGAAPREVAFHDGVKQYVLTSGLADEYDKYIDADPKLKDDTKKIRKDTSKGLRALIAEEGKALEKGK
jgi:hypothetical protein